LKNSFTTHLPKRTKI